MTKPIPRFDQFRTEGYESKIWILPNGDIQPLDRSHATWLLANRSELKSRFGLDLDDFSDAQRQEQAIRLAAVRHGFVRVHFSHRTAILTVEVQREFVSKSFVSAVMKLLVCNLPFVDHLRLHRIGDEGCLTQREYVSWVGIEEGEKIRHLPPTLNSVLAEGEEL